MCDILICYLILKNDSAQPFKVSAFRKTGGYNMVGSLGKKVRDAEIPFCIHCGRIHYFPEKIIIHCPGTGEGEKKTPFIQ